MLLILCKLFEVLIPLSFWLEVISCFAYFRFFVLFCEEN